MSMSKHTPGPWTYGAKLTASENHRGFVIRSAKGWGLADVQPVDQDGIEGKENARLIAAAPDLLKAAIDLKDACNRPSAARTRAEAWRALDKAIAKAESQS